MSQFAESQGQSTTTMAFKLLQQRQLYDEDDEDSEVMQWPMEGGNLRRRRVSSSGMFFLFFCFLHILLMILLNRHYDMTLRYNKTTGYVDKIENDYDNEWRAPPAHTNANAQPPRHNTTPTTITVSSNAKKAQETSSMSLGPEISLFFHPWFHFFIY